MDKVIERIIRKDVSMQNNALYFPYINVPNNSWFFQMLLYWDKVGSIVPSEYIFEPENLTEHMRNLVAAELVEPIVPSRYKGGTPNFDEAFIEYITKEAELRKKSGNLKQGYTFDIHLEKMMWEISDALQRLDLARRIEYPWYRVEGWAADAFMTYLASSLGKLDEINSAPVTMGISSNLGGWSHQGNRVDVRTQILQSVLPYPEGDFDIDKLVRFKSDHGHLLAGLRNYIEIKSIEISKTANDIERRELIDRTVQHIKSESDGIKQSMKPFWERIALGVVIPLVSASIATLANEPFVKPVSSIVGGLSLVTAVYQAFDGSRQYKQAIEKPFAYITFAEKELSIG